MSGNLVRPGQTLIWTVWVLAAATKGLAVDAPSRNTRLGWVRGKQVTVLGSPVPVNVFLGVPFAAPPLGPLRFATPQPALPWEDFRDATSYPNLCLQNPEWLISDQRLLKVHYPQFGVSEDCLYLNIYAPAHAVTGSNLPVMVWFPGGAFETGSASVFDGSALAAYEDVLVVTTQYRLGLLGFFNTGDQHAWGNWAFKDQVAALTWVQENIKFFGGNPDSVTIFGESAGAISVSSLVLSPMANGLFHKAIMESGVAIIPFMKASDNERNQDLQFLANVCGCNASDSVGLLQCLRAKSSEELLSLSQKTKSFTWVIDGRFFLDNPLDLLIQKEFNPVPSIIGVNNHECGYMLPMKSGGYKFTIPSKLSYPDQPLHFTLGEKEVPEIFGGSNKSLIFRLIHTFLHHGVCWSHSQAAGPWHHSLGLLQSPLSFVLGLTENHQPSEDLHIPRQYLYFLTEEYFRRKDSMIEIWNSFLDLLGDVFFVVPGLVTAQYHRDAGAPVYFYEFQHRPQCFKDTKPAFVKADHADEIRFVFGGAFLNGDVVMFEGATQEEKLLSRKMMTYWANFARTGNPNGEGLPPWPAYTQAEQYLQLDLNIRVGERLKAPKVKLWMNTLPLIMSASGALLSPLSSLIFLSLFLPFLFFFAP